MPNRLARGLSARQLGVIAVLVPDLTNPYFTEIVHKIEEIANEQGLTVLLGNSDERPRARGGLSANRCRPAPGRRDPRSHRRRGGRERQAARERWDSGRRDRSSHRQAGAGHRPRRDDRTRPAAHAASDRARSPADRDDRRPLDRLHQPRARRGLSPGASRGPDRDGSIAVPGVEVSPVGRSRNRRELLGGSDPPTALLTANSFLAFGVISAAEALGLKVPDDLAIASFDDFEIGPREPILTCADQPASEIAELGRPPPAGADARRRLRPANRDRRNRSPDPYLLRLHRG